MKRRDFLRAAAGAVACAQSARAAEPASARRPNILFAIADDWSWPDASIGGTPEVATSHFDRVAREGALFDQAYTAAPQCSPNRAAILTGRHIGQLQEAGTHGSLFPNTYPVFTDLLEQAGYFIGWTGKGWSPGNWKDGGWDRNPAGPEFSGETVDPPADGMNRTDYAGNFARFLNARPTDVPFFFWLGAKEPHRVYEKGSWKAAGKNPDKVDVPGYLPDTPEIREDLLDYFVEVEWFDTHLGRAIAQLEAIGELDNTLIVVTGDNGMPFPRAKANLYEHGINVPFAVRWPGRIPREDKLTALLSHVDLAPTFLRAAGVPVPNTMVGRPIQQTFTSTWREFVIAGRERHTHARRDNLGYPARCIRTNSHLYIRNYKPDRWPAGDPPEYHDIDGCPTLDFLKENREAHKKFFDLAVAKRPAEELFNAREDPDCVNNLAGDPEHADLLDALRTKLDHELTQLGDPRALGNGDIFESYPRYSRMRPQLGGFAERGKYNPAYAPDEE